MNERIVILGATGMIGHYIYKQLIKDFNPSNIFYLTSKSYNDIKKFKFFRVDNGYFEINYTEFKNLNNLINDLKPEFIINCCGLTKKKCIGSNIDQINNINIKLPKFLSENAKINNYKYIHLSSDCVFSGKKGEYKTNDIKDASDLYGVSKSKSEYLNKSTLILRKSTIGLELFDEKHGLVEWFLSQNGIIKGYKNAIFNGLTTKELSKLIVFIIKKFPYLNGIYHVGSDSISKYDLLSNIMSNLKNIKKNIMIEPYEDFYCNRSLDCSDFYNITKYVKPNWTEMLNDLNKEILNNYYYDFK